MRPTKDEWAMNIALECAKRSTCLRRNVGCVLLNSRGELLSTGVNGVAKGQPHCNEVKRVGVDYGPENKYGVSSPGRVIYVHPNACPGSKAKSGQGLDGCYALHAEQNALLQCRDIWEIHTCVVTTSPCITCVKLLMNTSCERVLFLEEYPHSASKELWESTGKVWEKY